MLLYQRQVTKYDILTPQPFVQNQGPCPTWIWFCSTKDNSAEDVRSGPVFCFVCECGSDASMTSPCHTEMEVRGENPLEGLELLLFFFSIIPAKAGFYMESQLKFFFSQLNCISPGSI